MFGCASDEKKKETFLAESKTYFEAQEYKKALIQLKNVIKIDPKSIEANQLLAQTHLKLGEAREAFSTYLRLEQLEPENLDTKLKLATFYLLGKQIPEAKSRVDHVLTKAPETVEALFLHAGILSQEKADIEEIKQVYDKILEIDPEQAKAHMVLSKIFISQKDFGKAEENLTAALEFSPDDLNINKALVGLYLSQKDVDAAQNVLENLVKSKPESAEPLILLGNFHLTQKNKALAEKAFLTAIEKSPETIAPYMILARYYNSEKETLKAEQYIRKALEIDPENMGLKNAYADFHFSNQNFEKAEAIVDEELKERPDYIPSKLLKGKILVQKKEFNTAVQLFQELVKEEPNSQANNFLLGSTLLQKGEPETAQPYLSKTLEINPNHFPARMMMANIYYQKADYTLAETEVNRVLEFLPDHYEANILLGNIHATRKEYDAAAALFEKMMHLEPENPSAYFRLGVINRLQKNNDAAMAFFEKALKINPNLMDVFTNIIAVYSSQKQFTRAIERCDSQMALVGDVPVIHSILLNLKGNLLLAQNNKDQAKKELALSIEKNPKFVTPYLTLAKIYNSEKQTDREIEIYKALIEKRDDQPSPHSLLGIIYEKQEKYDLAETHYQKALGINSGYVPALNNLAYLYAEQNKDLNKALDLARNAKEKAGNAPAVIDTLGWVYYKKALYDSAAREFKECIQKDPNNPMFHYHLGLAYHKMEDAANAKIALNKALELQKDFIGADEARKVLDQL
jgi:tetratricopeptide (TPR) repeat protein